MIVKYRKAFFVDLANIKQLQHIVDIEFITEIANTSNDPFENTRFQMAQAISR